MKIQIPENKLLNLIEIETISKIKVDNQINEDIHFNINNGYGACKSCGCKGWIPNYPKNDYCKNCGHHWERHS